MEISGKVIKVLPTQNFVSKRSGEAIVKNFFIIETGGQYPKKLCFCVMGEDRWGQWGIRAGMDVTVSFDIESREWQDKWFTELKCWNVVHMNAASGQQKPQQQQPKPQPQMPNPFPTESASQGGGVDNLPF